MAVFWIISFIIFLIIEIATINLVSIWFVLGSLAALITSYITKNVFIQLFIFVIISTVSLCITKPLVKKFKNTKPTPTNLDRVIDKIGVVTKEITKDEYGEVKVMNTIWTAKADTDLEIGTKVKIIKIEGVKLIVEEEK